MKMTLLLFFISLNVWATEFVVLSTTANKFILKKTYDEEEIILKKGENLKLITVDGVFKEFSGPGEFSFDQVKGKEVSTLGRVAELVRKEKMDSSDLGAVRSGDVKFTTENRWDLLLGFQGNFCVQKGQQLKIVRSVAKTKIELKIKKYTKPHVSEKLHWGKGESYIHFPMSVPLVDGATYLIRAKGDALPKKIQLHFVPMVKKEAIIESWLIAKGCLAQSFLEK